MSYSKGYLPLEPLKVKDFVKEIYGKLVGDKGYISKELFHELFTDGIQLITKMRNNMKNCLISVSDKIYTVIS